MAIVRNVLLRVGADIKPLQKNLKQAQYNVNGFNAQQKKSLYSINTNLKSLLGNVSSSALGVKGSLSMVGAAAASLAVVAAAAFAVISVKAVKAAMDVVESENLFTVSMGGMAASARQWSEQLQQSLGLNGYEVRKNVGLFYNMTTSMGLARDKAYDVSTGITKLAYDMSSFYNTSYDDMFTKLQSGLSGEMEPLRRLGVIVSETVVKQYAYKNGIAAVGSELTESQKVLARYGVIMAQTGNAQGDLARTINSPSNQLRILQTQLQLAKINLGNAFMPIVEIVLPILTSFAKSLVSVTNIFAQFMRALFGSKAAQTSNAQSAADAAAAQAKLGNATAAAGAKAKKGVAGFDEVNTLQENIAANAVDAASASDALSTTPEIAKQDDTGSIIPKGILDMADKVKTAFQPIGNYISVLVNSFKNFWKEIQPSLQPIIEWLEPIFGGALLLVKTILINVFEASKGIVKGALDVIKGIIMVFSGLITGDWSRVWEGVKTIFSGIWEAIKSVVLAAINIILMSTGVTWEQITNALSTAWNWVKNNVGLVFNSAKDAIIGAWNAIQTTTSAVCDAITSKVQTSWNWVKDNASLIFDGAKDIIVNAWSAISKKATEIWEPISTKIKGIWNWIRDNATGVFDWSKGIITGAWDTIKTTTSTVWDSVSGAIKPVWNWIKEHVSIFTDVKNTIETAFNSVGSTVSNVWEGIKTNIKNSINGVIDLINSFINGINRIKITIPAVTVLGKTLFEGTDIGLPSIPNIPRLAKGGIISSPTLAMIGEQGKEAVMPLENTSFVDTLASAIGTAVLGAMQMSQTSNSYSGNQEIVLQMDSTKFARITLPALRKEANRLGTVLREV